MRHLKLAVLSLLVLFIIVTLISLFIPSRVRISRALDMSTSKEEIISLLSDLEKWKAWYPGFDSLQFEISADGQTATSATTGTQILLLESRNAEIISEIRSRKGRSLQNGWNPIPHNGQDSITLQTWMEFNLKWYPWEKFASLMFEKIYGSRLEKSLANLKLLAEN